MPKDSIKNIDLDTLLRYQIIIAQGGRSYTINNRKNGDLSRVHAHSPQVIAAKLPHGSALYFVSCDFKGDVMKYSDNKFEAVKAYLDVIGVEYRVVLCNTLPRHNWKHILRTKDVDLARYDEILKECKSDGKKAADLFYQEAEKAGPRSVQASEQELEKFAYRITQNANQHRVEQCRKIFSDDKVILWSDYDQNISTLIDEYQVALKGCYKECAEGARKREGNVVDNILYKQEELMVGLHIANSMAQQPVTGFYNEFSKQSEHTAHMIACQEFGHFELLDIFYDEEPRITQALLDLGFIAKNEEKPKDTEKELAQYVRYFPTIQPSLQKEFVLQLLEQSRTQVPSYERIITACLKLYKTLDKSRQLPFISALLDFPRKKILAYRELIKAFNNAIDVEFSRSLPGESIDYQKVPLAKEICDGADQVYASFEPTLLFDTHEKVQIAMQSLLNRQGYVGHSLIHITAQVQSRSSINLVSDSQNSTFLEIALDAGADPNVKDEYGRTPLYTAMYCWNLQGIKALLKAGAKIDENAQGEHAELAQLEHLKRCPQIKETKEIVSVLEKALAHQKSQHKV